MLLCRWAIVCGLLVGTVSAAEPTLFARSNLVAWCIVPFDAKKRTPEERAELLAQLGFTRFAYDWRAEHLPTFPRELAALKKANVTLSAVWFPATLNADAKYLLAELEKAQLKPQLWVTLTGGSPTPTAAEHQQQLEKHVAALRPLAEAADKIGCTVGLYNHGGWFGEPEHQLAVLTALQCKNVGIVYNLHHGHDHLDRLATILPKLVPHLYCVNLNGMVPNGDKKGQKIVPLGAGERDLAVLQLVVASGYRGPIGILGHTQDDAGERLRDNLAGLDWLVPQLAGKPVEAKPVWRTWKR